MNTVDSETVFYGKALLQNMSKNKKEQENYLDYIPKHNSLFPFEKNENNRIEVMVHNKGLMNRIAQMIFRRPKYSRIELDDFGSFIWEQIDGEKTIYGICDLIKAQFGEEAEPLYERATTFFQILRRNSFIVYMNKK
ncbi:MAG: PqqD family protein [Lachnospiraceae bacterium]|nr:PqqD family protein [Lachnospiraceae bacterium]